MSMNKMQAKLALCKEINRQAGPNIHIACLEDGKITAASLDAIMWNISFAVGAPLGEIQITVEFNEDWIDILAFPHPRIIDEGHVLEMMRFVNCLNGYIKLQRTHGRFFVDENDLDVAYNARLSYEYLELMPQEAVSHGVLGFLGFVADAAVPLYQVGHGKMTAAEGCQYMVERWGL